MAYVLSDHILSPLGTSSAANYQQVKQGKSALRAYAPDETHTAEICTASLMEGQDDSHDAQSQFERLVSTSAAQALAEVPTGIDYGRMVFILSTTKGNVENLRLSGAGEDTLGEVACRVAAHLGLSSTPIVVCNACISGLSAIILANRLIDMGCYDYALVCGADSPRQFIISGFQSLKALSPLPCRPFDMERMGLNLGEAVATMVLGRARGRSGWLLRNGYVNNDAFHVTTPIKTGEGLYQALTATLADVDVSSLAFVNAHGTATLFNDQMESVAMGRAGLSEVPANALKGYFGHTLGAAGLLETIISMHAADDGIVLGTRGFEERGVSGKMNMQADNRPCTAHNFVKMLSGFGGCNASILAEKDDGANPNDDLHHPNDDHYERRDDLYGCGEGHYNPTHHVRLTPQGAWVDGNRLPLEGGDMLLTRIYKTYIKDYPKYYKMDALSRLGFVAADLLLAVEGRERFVPCSDRAIVLCNRTSSVHTDLKYLQSIADADNYFPSPSVFVYTLPNIVTGEIAIRNAYHAETSFYILPDKADAQVQMLVSTAFADHRVQSVLGGWVDYQDEHHYEADLYLLER